jgi:Papain-like cysteine protease AvrRpt2
MDDILFDTKLDGSGYGQPTAETCWYACYAMIFAYKQKPVTAIKDAIVKAGFNFDDYYKNGLPVEDFRKVGLALGLTGFRGGFMSTLGADFQWLAQHLKSYGPTWCAFSRPSAHIVVICGVDSKLNQIHIMNPWNQMGGFDADGQYITPGTFQSRLNTSSEWVGQCPG